MSQISESLRRVICEFIDVRKTTLELFKPLKIEDAAIQSDSFGSPPNWHMAHVTWFFQKILEIYGKNVDEKLYGKLNMTSLNSYYQKYGIILPKTERGKYARPTVGDTLRYRKIIEEKIMSFLEKSSIEEDFKRAEIIYDMLLGNQHEMQHQELMIYDFQHYFERFLDEHDNYFPFKIERPPVKAEENVQGMMVEIPGGMFDLGYSGGEFCYDNELPEHKVYLYPFRMDIVPVTNGQFLEFIEDGGYKDYKKWLADGWELVQKEEWSAPL